MTYLIYLQWRWNYSFHSAAQETGDLYTVIIPAASEDKAHESEPGD